MADLGAFFKGANLGRRVARFDPFTWWAHSLQNQLRS